MIKIQDFLDPGKLQPLVIDGEASDAFCRMISLDDLGDIMVAGQPSVKFAARLLAISVVQKDGTPVATAEEWLRVPFRNRKRFDKLVNVVQRVNGLLEAGEAEELGKPSETTGAPVSNSSCASDSEKAGPSCDEE